MGVYIPPGSNRDNDKDKDKDKDKQSKANGNSPGAKDSYSDNSYISNINLSIKQFLETKLKYGVNPSLGLAIWGPLVPPPDNTLGLRILTGVQIVLGIVGLNKARLLRNKRLRASGTPVNFGSRFNKWTYAILGTLLMVESGYEFTRLISPYDPWLDERDYYKQIAISLGKPIHWWFGPMNYSPMSSKEFIEKLEVWVDNRLEMHDSQELDQVAGDLSLIKNRNNDQMFSQLSQSPILSSIQNKLVFQEASPSLSGGSSQVIQTPDGKITKIVRIPNASKLLNHEKFSHMYDQVKQRNQDNYNGLLGKELKDVNELNKAERIDAILEGSGTVFVNPDYSKPNIHLGTHKLDTDDDLDSIWTQFEPWEELKVETDYDIRLIPRWNRQEYEVEVAGVVPPSEKVDEVIEEHPET